VNKLFSLCTCDIILSHTIFGFFKHGSRIVGGSDTKSGQFPWLAYINIEGSGGISVCGGSLISHRHILTAAHCITEGKSDKMMDLR
jgi:secreted trypsin-like serine protease